MIHDHSVPARSFPLGIKNEGFGAPHETAMMYGSEDLPPTELSASA